VTRAALAGVALTLALSGRAPDAAAQPAAGTATAAEAERAREATRLEAERFAAANDDLARQGDGPGLAALVVQMVAVMGGVSLLAYLVLGKVLPRVLKVEQPIAPRRLLRVVDRLMIDQRRSIMVLKSGEQYFLVGSTEHGINLLSRLDASEVEAALAGAGTEAGLAPLASAFGALLERRPGKES
jgi:flagellar biogenesis protein FliO